MSGTVILGGRQFALHPLKLGQLRHLLDALDDMQGKSAGALIEAAAKVVATGLAPCHPGLDAAAILDLEASADELNAAVAAILAVAGLKPVDDPVGEGLPVAGPDDGAARNSARFTPPSPPAAATPTTRSTD